MSRFSCCLALLIICSALLPNAQAQAEAVIPANEAAAHIGQYATVEGVVAKVFTSKSGNTFLNIGASYPNQTFTGWVPLYDQTEQGRTLRILTLIDEYTKECLAIHADYSIRAVDAITVLEAAIQRYGPPQHLRSDNGPEFIAQAIQDWLKSQRVRMSATEITGDDIKAWRARKALTQAMAARRLGLAKATLQDWERGRRTPGITRGVGPEQFRRVVRTIFHT